MEDSKFEDDFVTKMQLIVYLLDNLPEKSCEKLKLVKLIALADIYKLRLDGSTITNDQYFAFKNGPAASYTANIINLNTEWLNKNVLDFVDKHIESCNKEVKLKKVFTEYDYLSVFERKCADYVINNYGKLSADDLIEGNNGDNVHAFYAWEKHNIKEYGVREKIDLLDFFKNDGPVQVNEKNLEQARRTTCMSGFNQKDVAYYTSPILIKKGVGAHYHILLGRFTSQRGYEWYQLIVTSKQIEGRYENVLVIDPSECEAFTKPTRIRCDRLYHFPEQVMQTAKIRGTVSDAILNEVKKRIKRSGKVRDVVKKRLLL